MVLNWLDYAVIGVYLLAIIAFGSWFARFQKTTRDYFLTDRSVPWWAICFTIVATETSTLSFIGVPAGAYAGNMTFLQLAIGYIVGRLLVSVLFIPSYFRGELFTSYELLQRRFGAPVKNVAAVIFLVDADVCRRHPAVRHGAGDRGRDAGAGHLDGARPRRRDDRLHRPRRRLGGDLDRCRPDVHLRRRRAAGVLRAAAADSRRLGRSRVGSASTHFRVFDFSHRSAAGLHLLGRTARRRSR